MSAQFTDHRDAAFGALARKLDEDFPLVVLTNDMGAFGLSILQERYPDRVLNVGIQEQNLISVASGFALGGLTPVIYGIAAHLVGRSYEQVRLDLAFTRIHALVLSAGPGLTYGADGPTHQALHEPALLATLPGITYTYPTNPRETYASVLRSLHGSGLQWISLDKASFEAASLKPVKPHLSWGFINRGSNTVLLTYGSVSEVVYDVADERELDFIQLNQVLPFPTDLVDTLASYDRVIVLEEASWPGVLTGTLAATFKANVRTCIRTVALPVNSPLGNWSRADAWGTLRSSLNHVLDSSRDS
jgi:transketolase